MKTWKILAVLSLVITIGSGTLVAQPPRRRPQSPTDKRLQDRKQNGFPKYDLVMADLSRTGNVIQMTIRNQGPVATPASQVYVQAIEFRTGKVVQSKFARVSPLQPNKSMQIRMHNFGPVRNVKLWATVDPYNKLAEANEGNNSRGINVGDTAATGADLAIVAVTASANSGRIVVRVQNVGKTRLTQRVPVVITTSFGLKQHERLTSTVTGLRPGQQMDLVLRPRQRLLNSMMIEAKADPNNALPESNEANNRRAVSYPTR